MKTPNQWSLQNIPNLKKTITVLHNLYVFDQNSLPETILQTVGRVYLEPYRSDTDP